jgi:hypothetical protein
MRRNEAAFAVGVLAVVVGGILFTAQWARAKDAPADVTQKMVDHPFVKALLGTWDWTSKTPNGVDDKGTETFRLALLDTAVFDEIEGTAMGKAFQGHGVWKISDDGATFSGWWFFSANPGVKAFRGSITADGYDLKDDQGNRMVLKRTAGGLEMTYSQGETTMRSVTYTKR